MSGWPMWALLVIFAAAAGAIWVAGISLSNQTDVLSTRLHLGSALGGLILLAITLSGTALPYQAEIASSLSSSSYPRGAGPDDDAPHPCTSRTMADRSDGTPTGTRPPARSAHSSSSAAATSSGMSMLV